LKQLTADNPTQQATLSRLEPLLKAHLALFAREVNRPEQEKELLETSKQLLDQIRDQIRTMKANEEELLAIRLEATEHSSRQTKAVIASGYFVP